MKSIEIPEDAVHVNYDLLKKWTGSVYLESVFMQLVQPWIVYKYLWNKKADRQVYCQLVIPTGAIVHWQSGSFYTKFRVSEAIPIKIVDLDGNSYNTGYTYWDYGYGYYVGRPAFPKKVYCSDIYSACDSGIHVYYDVDETYSQFFNKE